MNFDHFTYFSSLGFIYVYCRLVGYYAPATLSFFLNTRSSFTSNLEKPRMLFHITGLFFMHLIFSYNRSSNNSSWIVQLIMYTVFFLGAYFCKISWGKKFTSTFSRNSRINTNNTKLNFNLIYR